MIGRKGSADQDRKATVSVPDLADDAYHPRLIRRRASKPEMLERRRSLLEIVAEQRPMTVRQAFYQATVRGVIEKTESGYAKIKTALADMRRDGELPYDWIADNTRWMRKPTTYGGPEDAIISTVRFYRKALWANAGAYVEVWLEKDALASVLYEVTETYDVPLMVSRGYASLSFLHSAAETMAAQARPCHIYHLGDFDPSCVDAARKIDEALHELAPSAVIAFSRIAVRPEQISAWSLPTRPTKTTDTRAKSWGGGDESVELDAIEPEMLRALVRERIERHLPPDEFGRLQQIEEAERKSLREYLAGWRRQNDEGGDAD
jgi:hypothetical protein